MSSCEAICFTSRHFERYISVYLRYPEFMFTRKRGIRSAVTVVNINDIKIDRDSGKYLFPGHVNSAVGDDAWTAGILHVLNEYDVNIRGQFRVCSAGYVIADELSIECDALMGVPELSSYCETADNCAASFNVF